MARVFRFLMLWFFGSASFIVSAQDYWTSLSRPTNKNLNRACFLDSATGWVVGERGTILRTSNGAQNWTSVSLPTGADMADIEMAGYSRGWVLANEFSPDSATFGSRIFRTSNGGNQWTLLGHYDQFLLCIDFIDSLNGFAGTIDGKILRTLDGGDTWEATEIDSSAFAPWPVRHIEFFSATHGFGMGGQRDLAGTIWVTTDGGLNWKPKAVTSEPVYAIHYFDSLRIMCAGGDPDFGAGMATTTDGGVIWNYSYLGIWGEVRGLGFRTAWEGWSPLGFAGTYMHTTDGGTTWTWTTAPNSTAVFDIAFPDSLTGYMVGERGIIMKYRHPIVAVDDHVARKPSDVVLGQNFPNPFNPTTHVRYELPGLYEVIISIHDALGREVRKFRQGVQPAGEYAVTLDASGMASGVYFCRLLARPTSGRQAVVSQTRKMILLR